jgi:hypothetical protein
VAASRPVARPGRLGDNRGVTPADAVPVSESLRRLPAPALRPYIAFYSGYRQVGVPPARHRGLPSPYLTMIVTFDHPLTVATRPGLATRSYDTLIGGFHTTPAIDTHEGRQAGIQVALSPLAHGSCWACPPASSPTSTWRRRRSSAPG